MRFEHKHTCRLLVLLVVVWAALAIFGGALNKADVELGSGAGSSEAAIELGLKLCAVIFTAVAAVASGVLRKLRRLPAYRAGIGNSSPIRLKDRYRPPPHGVSLLRSLQIIIV